MHTGLRALLVLGLLAVAARPAIAHTIGVRDGGGSTDLCGTSGLLGQWVSLEAEVEGGDGDPAGEESINNNCGVSIFSLDIQLSDDGDTLTHPPDPIGVAENSIFDTLQLVQTDFGSAFRFYSSQGNSIFCDTCFSEFFLLSTVIGPEFIFFVNPDSGDPYGFFRIVDFNQEPIPEPATLLLLGTGLGGVLLKRRRK